MYLLRRLAIFFSLLHFVHSIQIYITNTEYVSSEATCEIKNISLYPCEILANLNRKLDSFKGTLHITLLPGDYYIHDSFSLRIDSISNVYFNSWNNLGQVRVICDGGDFSLDYTNVSIVSISNVEFYHCSSAAPTISTVEVSKVTIKYVNFTNSSAHYVKVRGTAHVNDLNINHCVFNGSTKNIGVNVTSISSQIVIIDTVFENNNLGSLKLTNWGNVIVMIKRCVFAHNRAGNSSRGAAIVAVSSAMTVIVDFNDIKISYCQFLNNSADDGGAVVITNFYRIYVDNSEFKNNIAYDSGGVIKLEGRRIHERCEFIFENCTFIHNYAKNGEVIYIELITWSTTLHAIANSNFSNNNATKSGGAIFIVKETPCFQYSNQDALSVYINNVTLDNNLAKKGGALYLRKVNNITLTNCSLRNNTAHHASSNSIGGAIAIIQNVSSFINIKKTTFSYNTADIGGAISISSSILA